MKSKTNETRNENLRIHTTSRCISLLLGFARGWKAIANGYITWACAIRKLSYSNATAIQDKSAWKNLYNKTWTNPNILTPGIFLVLCPCPKKSVYGFSLMVKAESPSYIFDIVTTRFESHYRPDWVYDASCKAKEFGMNREPNIYSEFYIVSDPFHEPSHTTHSVKSTVNARFREKNKEAAEQFNRILSRITTPLPFMKPSKYMRALTIYCAYQNVKKKYFVP